VLQLRPADQGLGNADADAQRPGDCADLAAIGHHHRAACQRLRQCVDVLVRMAWAKAAARLLALLVGNFAACVARLDVPACPADQLAAGVGAAVEMAADLFVLQIEHVVQQEGCTLQR
jgi:hypothetical protein